MTGPDPAAEFELPYGPRLPTGAYTLTRLLEPPPRLRGHGALLGRHPRAAPGPAVVSALRPGLLVPREVCPGCLAPDVEWRPAAGTGVAYAAGVHHKPGFGRSPGDGPDVVALVELAEGVRMMSNVVGVPPDDVVVGMPVALAWHRLADGRRLPMFTPA